MSGGVTRLMSTIWLARPMARPSASAPPYDLSTRTSVAAAPCPASGRQLPLLSYLRTQSEPPQPRRRLLVQNLGCHVNDYDVERMRQVMAPDGFDEAATAEEADLIVINTCSVREKAEAK